MMKNVLDIGCGDGELTLFLAKSTANTIGIDPDGEDIAAAQANTPEALADRVDFIAKSIADYQPESRSRFFDIALFLWSL